MQVPLNAYSGNPIPSGGPEPSPTSELAKLVRAKYPGAYDDIPDAELDAKVRAKYPGAYDDIPGIPKSSVSRFVGGVGEMLNPVSAVKGIAGMIAHPIDNVFAPMVVNRVKADEMDKQGRTADAMGYRAGGIIPIIGPMATGIGEKIGSGDVAGGLGNATGALLGGKMLEAAPAAIRAIPAAEIAAKAADVSRKVAANPTVRAIGVAGATYGLHSLYVANPGLALAVAAGISGKIMTKGGAISAIVDYLRKDGIPAADAIKQASAVADEVAKAPEAALAKLKTPEYLDASGKLPSGFTMDAKAMGGPGVTPEQLAAAPSDIAQFTKIAPIPPNKLPPVLPDPVVPELAPAPVIVPKSKPAPKVKAEPPKAPEPVSVATSAVSEQTPIAKYYNLHPERSAPEGTVGVHPTLGLPMNAEGKVLVRNVEDFPSETRAPGSQPEGGTVWRDPNRSFFGNPSVQDIADTLKARADAKPPSMSLSDQMSAIGKGDGVDRMKVPKVSESLAVEQARGLQKAQEYVAKTSPDIVTAPKAFDGQQGAKGATQARFKDIAKRTVEGWIKSGKTDKFLMDKLQNMFKMSADDSEALIREVGGKN